MTFPINISKPPIKHASIGTCPHGLPMGACPICSGSGGGGGGSSKKAAAPAGEMSWDECFAVGQMMKSQRLAQQERLEKALHAPIQQNVSFENKMAAFAQNLSKFAPKITDFVQKLENSIPKPLAKAVQFVATQILIPVLNVVQNLATVVQKTLQNISQKLADISDKLTAVFGELKNNIEKKLSDKFNDFKKKAKKFFGVFGTQEIDEEENKLEEEKRIFELKNTLNEIEEKITPNPKDELDEN